MQTISTKYIGPSNTKPSRVKAVTSCGITKTISFDCGDRVIDAHFEAARALAKSLKWEGKMIGGSTQEGYVFVFANDDVFTI